MQFDFAELAPRERYKLLTATIVPRPIAFVTSLAANGAVNAAPFSFFNVFSEDPALVVLGIESRRDGRPKDTTANIEARGEFVVNLVDEALVEAMVACAADFPAGESELAAVGLETAPPLNVAVPRIATAPVSLECRTFELKKVTATRYLVIGEIGALHARDGLIDPDTLRLNWDRYNPAGRLYANGYIRTRDRFDLAIPAYEDVAAKGNGSSE